MNLPHLLLLSDHYTEGIVVDSDGTIFFSKTSAGTISRFVPGDAAATVWAHVPAANGHAIRRDGAHVVMSSAGSVLVLDGSGRVTSVIASRVSGRWLTYPNDLSLDPRRGGFYFTDSGYKATPATVPPDAQGRVYRVEPDGSVREVAAGLAYSNGVALAPDGNSLYVGESTACRIWSYGVRADGSLRARTLFAQTPAIPGHTPVPDGITIGPDERVYVAHYGAREVLVYDPNGTLVQRLGAGNKAASHVAFAPHGRALYVSGGIENEDGDGAIFEIALSSDDVEGVAI